MILLLRLLLSFYQTLGTVFHWLSKHLKFCQNYSAARHIFYSLLSVWISWWNTVSCVSYITKNTKAPWSNVRSDRSYKEMTNLSTVNTRAILPMARILLRITSFLLSASLCSSSSSPSSSSSVQILRIFTSISVTSNKVKNKSWMEESSSCLSTIDFLNWAIWGKIYQLNVENTVNNLFLNKNNINVQASNG